jgi:hypothetical protein
VARESVAVVDRVPAHAPAGLRRDARERAFVEAESDRSGQQNEYFEWHTTRRPTVLGKADQSRRHR